QVEQKWQRKWEEAKIFEADPDPSKPKCFITVAYPYPNSPQHIGHGRTYTLADVHARYMRMKGYNVLFPMGFHYTGTPILAMSKRIAENDIELIKTFTDIYKVPKEIIERFVEPIEIAKYFKEEIKQGMIEMGYSIDWRREFTTVDKLYNKFIEWQFRKLKNKGYIVQGSHPVGWCPKDNSPVSQHDTLGDIEPEFNEYTLIKFDYNEAKILVATLRPETIFGVTNLWINPNGRYVKARVNNEIWIVSESCANKLSYLNKKVEILEKFNGSTLINKEVRSIHNRTIKILEASFVDEENGTGIVMSVPAHAPYDYQALVDLRLDINPIVIIRSEKYNDKIPAYEVIKEFNIKDQNDPRLEDATATLYSYEFYNGVMIVDEYKGIKVSDARDAVKSTLIRDNYADTMLELTKDVRCRCGTKCVVKILNDQWFIDYSKREWKDLAHECLNRMNLLPNDIREEFEYTIEWLRERACARRSGLGTKLPWDKEWIIESLSDSVIYMAYYIIAKFADKIDIDSVDDAFFDYIFNGGKNVEQAIAEDIKREFEYFYPVDSRHSGRDLIPNHLTFFIFNHTALFEKERWPKEIVVNGSVLMEGKKMSKSFGNIIPLRSAIKEHGADAIRAAILITSELLQDADFTFDILSSVKNKLEKIYENCKELKEYESNDRIDRWLRSTLQHTIIRVTASMDKLRVREALHEILYSMDDMLEWYITRKSAKGDKPSLKQFFDVRIRLLAPFTPFICEEIWHMFGNDSFVSLAEWPNADERLIDYDADHGEILIMSVLEDIKNILKVTKIKPKDIYIYTASNDKCAIYSKILLLILKGEKNISNIIKDIMKNDNNTKKMVDMIKKMVDDILSISDEIREKRVMLDEKSVLNDAKELFEREFNASIHIYNEDDKEIIDPKSKAKYARPYKPAIYID
ncbi:MAG: leucine--tRNA ligase, partial [Candidatus Nitrosocaldaceae archaeon]